MAVLEMSRRVVAASALALLGACTSSPEHREPPAPAKGEAKPAPQAAPFSMTTCTSPLATVIVIEAQPESGGMGGMGGMGMSGMQGDPYARLQIPPLARIARGLADKSGCFRTLEADPALLAIPGSVQPELALRVRASALHMVERSLPEKATAAARRYIGRITGDVEPEPDALRAAEVMLDLVCPKQRRVIQVFKGSADGALGEPSLTGEHLDTVRGASHERVALAYAKAQDAALLYLRAGPRPCE